MSNFNSAITAQDITKSFGKLKAVDKVTLSIREGEIFGLIGPDGAGKTTLMRMLAGMLTPDSGDASICGRSSLKQHQQIKDDMAYMSQKFGLYQDLTVYENIRLYADLYDVSKKNMKEQINDLLDFSYMRPFRNRRAGKLSGGMKQKLQLICALVHKPKVLLLDEPTNGVDPVSRRDFWRILYNLSAEGVTILVSTAYLDEAERCSRIALMNNGRIITTGTPSSVIDESGIKIASVKTQDNQQNISKIRNLFPDSSIHIFGEKIRINTSDYQAASLKLNENLDGETEITQEKPMLEDIFMSLQSRSGSSEKLLSMVSEGIEKREGSSVITSSLTKRFGDFTAVNSIELDVKYGEIFGFLGPNGAGKSTTIKMLCGLLIPTSGNGSVGGFDISKNPEKIKENIGYMSQKFSLYEDLKIYENIDFYGGIYGLSGDKLKKRRDWALELSGLKERSREITANLAGGWRQRLALACSIIHSPSIVFLDEPTSGADPASRRLFWDIISSLAAEGVTVFVSTHYMEEAEYCNRLSMIFRGNMIAHGTPFELKEKYMDDKIVNISVEQPQTYIEELSKMEGMNDVALFGAGLHARTSDPDSVLNKINKYFSAKSVHADSKLIQPSMEDVFVSLIDQAEVADA
ncbi:MAG: ABC transporter ATP-binding protein [Denitrovibrio sp.]|nr:MAG: ABC transporter ATP-binding protein [Denitrovibrio sp.]